MESAGVITTIDLGGICVAASASVILVNGSFFLRGPRRLLYGMTWGTLGDPAANQGRTELVRYDSPTLAGFIFSASIAEAGDYWGAMLRYAGEFSGFRIAAGIGYEKITDRSDKRSFTPISVPCAGLIDVWSVRAGLTSRPGALALSVMHVPTGLFAQGHYMAADYSQDAALRGYWGQRFEPSRTDADQWLIQAGITKNWFGVGNTAIYGEYGRQQRLGRWQRRWSSTIAARLNPGRRL